MAPAERLQQAKAIETILLSKNEQALADYLRRQPNRLLSAIEDQVSRGVLYSLFARDDVFIAANARGLIRIEQKDPSDPHSPMMPIQSHLLPEQLFNDQRASEHTFFPADTVFGLGMTFNGVLIINTVSGRLITLNPQSFEVLDSLLLPDGEVISNSMATSEELGDRAVYVASNKAMYRFLVEPDGGIHRSEAAGGWRATYTSGRRLPYGKISTGTGATPTLMGFGPGEDISQSEQSVVSAGPYAFVVSSVPQGKAPPGITPILASAKCSCEPHLRDIRL